jgi:hypothetical protein
MRQFAACVARQRPRTALTAVLLPYGSPEQRSAVANMVQMDEQRCIGNSLQSLRFGIELMAGGVAEHFLNNREAGVDPASVQAMTEAQLEARGVTPRNGMEDMGLCICAPTRRPCGSW